METVQLQMSSAFPLFGMWSLHTSF